MLLVWDSPAPRASSSGCSPPIQKKLNFRLVPEGLLDSGAILKVKAQYIACGILFKRRHRYLTTPVFPGNRSVLLLGRHPLIQVVEPEDRHHLLNFGVHSPQKFDTKLRTRMNAMHTISPTIGLVVFDSMPSSATRSQSTSATEIPSLSRTTGPTL